MKKKIIYIAPHLSTGGLPQYLFKKIDLLKDKLEIYCIEFHDITGGQLIVQKDRIKSILDRDHFITLGNDKLELIKHIQSINPDYIHLEEIPEDGGWNWTSTFVDMIYNLSRKYKIFETSHDSSFDPDNKKIYFPDAFFFVSQWQIDQYKNINVPKYLAEYPIEYKERPDRNSSLKAFGLDPSKKHVLNVGLFTPRKNQGEIFEIAKHFGDEIQFHFLGNQAGNFEHYWKPLMEKKPNNCIWWGERNDADRFYSCMDLFLFTSEGNPGNKETMPLVLREAIGWKMKILLYNLDVYQNYFNRFNNITYLNEKNKKENVDLIKKSINYSYIEFEEVKVEDTKNYFLSEYNRGENKLTVSVIKEHPVLSKFNYRLRDAINGLTFQPMGKDLDFKKDFNMWLTPNATPQDHNGILLEILDDKGNVIESHCHESWGDVKSLWSPLTYPKTELWINEKLIKLHHDPNDQSSYWTYYECILRQDYKEIEAGDIIVDVGANLGFFSLGAIRQGASKSYAIEPFKKTFEYLVKNTEGLPIIPINFGVGPVEKDELFIGGEVTSITRSIDLKDKEKNAYWGDNVEHTTVKLKPFQSILNENNITFIDYLKIDCEGGEVHLFNTIDPDFLKYRIKKIAGEIHLFATGVDGYEKIKNQITKAGFDYWDDYKEGRELVIFFAKRKPKIKLVHILNNPEGAREIPSINSLKELSKYGIEYTQSIKPLYKGIPPAGNCLRPDKVAEAPGYYLLGPGHYGCYLGHKGAICDTDNCDGILVAECDTLLQVPAKEMAEKIFQVYFENIKNNLIWTSFGKKLPGHAHHLVTDDLYSTNKIVEVHLYLASMPGISELRGIFNNSPWEAADLWYDIFLQNHKRGILRKPYALQSPGISSIDQSFKEGINIHDHSVIYDPNFIDNDVTVIIQSCDAYRKFWDGWYLSWNRYWNWDLNWPIYFCNEELDLPFRDPRIQQIKSPKSLDKKGFSDRMIDILSKIKTKYVLYIQEDMWLTNKLDSRVFKEGLYKMRYNNWNCLRIHEKIGGTEEFVKSNNFINGTRLLKMKSTSEWLLTHNASIWNKEFLIESIGPNEDPWTNERDSSIRISKKYTDPKIYHFNDRWYYQPGASQNGEINPYMKEYEGYLKMNLYLKKSMDL